MRIVLTDWPNTCRTGHVLLSCTAHRSSSVNIAVKWGRKRFFRVNSYGKRLCSCACTCPTESAGFEYTTRTNPLLAKSYIRDGSFFFNPFLTSLAFSQFSKRIFAAASMTSICTLDNDVEPFSFKTVPKISETRGNAFSRGLIRKTRLKKEKMY